MCLSEGHNPQHTVYQIFLTFYHILFWGFLFGVTPNISKAQNSAEKLCVPNFTIIIDDFNEQK